LFNSAVITTTVYCQDTKSA